MTLPSPTLPCQITNNKVAALEMSEKDPVDFFYLLVTDQMLGVNNHVKGWKQAQI